MSAINDTRANPLQKNVATGAAEQHPAAAPSALETIYCRDCRHWDRRWPQANHAQCLQATKFAVGGSPLLTTDLQTCSHAQR